MSPGQKNTALKHAAGNTTLFLCAAVWLLLCGPLVGQPLEELPGYVDFESFGSFDPDDLSIEINLGGSLIKLLSSAVEGEDDEFSRLLSSLKRIKVNVFKLGEDGSAGPRFDDALKDLERQGWETLVKIRDDETIHILIRTDGELIYGLLAAYTEPGESLGLVNIVGDFDPAQIARLARQFDIGPLEDLDLDDVLPEEDRQ